MPSPPDEVLQIRDGVGFFQAVRAVLAKSFPGAQKTDEEIEHVICQLVSRAVVSEEAVDILTLGSAIIRAAGASVFDSRERGSTLA